MGSKRVLAVDAIVLYEDTILLVKRKYEPYQGYWALPGGMVEDDETVEQAVLRELKEETNIDGYITSTPPVITSTPGRDPRGPSITIAYRILADNLDIFAGDDAEDVKMFPIDALPPLAFDHKDIIKECLIR